MKTKIFKQGWGDGDYQVHDDQCGAIVIPIGEVAKVGRELLRRVGLKVTNTESVEPS